MQERLRTITPSELEAQLLERGAGLSQAQLAQTRASLATLHVAPLVFQPRNMKDKPWEKERHIANLAKIAKRPGEALDPIAVYPVAGIRIVVDGHCRLEAYRRAQRPQSTQVPIRHLRGTFAEVLVLAASSNSKDKLALSYWEKAEKAWQLVRFSEGRGCYSQRAISNCTGISKGTVQNMQARLGETDAEIVRSLTWSEVLRKDRGAEDRVEHDEQWEEATAQEWAVRLRRTFGDKPNAQPGIWRRAVEIAYRWNDGDEEEIGGEVNQEESDF